MLNWMVKVSISKADQTRHVNKRTLSTNTILGAVGKENDRKARIQEEKKRRAANKKANAETVKKSCTEGGGVYKPAHKRAVGFNIDGSVKRVNVRSTCAEKTRVAKPKKPRAVTKSGAPRRQRADAGKTRAEWALLKKNRSAKSVTKGGELIY